MKSNLIKNSIQVSKKKLHTLIEDYLAIVDTGAILTLFPQKLPRLETMDYTLSLYRSYIQPIIGP